MRRILMFLAVLLTVWMVMADSASAFGRHRRHCCSYSGGCGGCSSCNSGCSSCGLTSSCGSCNSCDSGCQASPCTGGCSSCSSSGEISEAPINYYAPASQPIAPKEAPKEMPPPPHSTM